VKSPETRGKHWLTNPYHRKSVARDLKGFCGWKRLNKVINALDEYEKERARRDDLNIGDCGVILFTGGFRIDEVLHAHLTAGGEVETGLKPENIVVRFNEKAGRKQLVFEDCYALKKYTKSDPITGKDGRRHYRTIERIMGKPAWRTAGVELWEPFVSRILDFAKKTDKEDYLFPNLSRQVAYQIIRKVTESPAGYFWPHRFRAERANQLVEDYGWSVDDLMRWYAWKNYSVAIAYASGDWQSASARMPSDVPKRSDLARFQREAQT
jgi:hypothetical protein